MKSWHPIGAVLVVLAAWPSLAPAQTPAPGEPNFVSVTDTFPQQPAAEVGVPPVPRVADAFPQSSLFSPDKPWEVDVLLGAPTGVRLQRDIWDDGRVAVLGEGFLGVEVIFPAAGVGLRTRLVPCCGPHDALLLNPGVDAYILANPFSHSGGFLSGGPDAIGFFTADVDLIWQHYYSPSCSGDIGLKLGGGVSGATGRGVPVGDIFFGWRF